MQVATEGDSLTACHISSSADCIAFGGSGGFLHLWSHTDMPVVNPYSQPLEYPPPRPNHTPLIREGDSLSLVPQYYCSGRLLSDVDPNFHIDVGKPPHLIEKSLLKGIKQVSAAAATSEMHSYAIMQPVVICLSWA